MFFNAQRKQCDRALNINVIIIITTCIYDMRRGSVTCPEVADSVLCPKKHHWA